MFAYFHASLPWKDILRRMVTDTFDDGCPGLAAQLAFYFLLALFPALLFLVSLLAYLPIDAALASAVDRMQPFLPRDVLAVVDREIDKLLSGNRESLLTFAIAGAVWSSSSAMTAVITTLNRAFDIDEGRRWWKTRLTAVALSIALALFTAAAFALVVGGSDLAEAVAARLGAGAVFERIWGVLQWPVAIFFVLFAVELVYHFAPAKAPRWAWVTPGSLLAVALWLATSIGFKLYLQHVSNIAIVYGAIGSVIVLLLWFYLSGFALLAGAELNAEINRALPPEEREVEADRTPHGGRMDAAAERS